MDVNITKTYDLILWSCYHTGKFPRNHRFVLGERIEKANLMLEILRLPMRLAKDLQCLKVDCYGFATKAIDEIGA
jgi:hypothetical protein